MVHEHFEIGTSFRINGHDVGAELVQRRMKEAYDRTREQLTASLYSGVPLPQPRLTWREKLRRKLDRVHDAWLVLTRRADIEY